MGDSFPTGRTSDRASHAAPRHTGSASSQLLTPGAGELRYADQPSGARGDGGGEAGGRPGRGRAPMTRLRLMPRTWSPGVRISTPEGGTALCIPGGWRWSARSWVVARRDEHPVAAAGVVDRRLDGAELPGEPVIVPTRRTRGAARAAGAPATRRHADGPDHPRAHAARQASHPQSDAHLHSAQGRAPTCTQVPSESNNPSTEKYRSPVS